MSEHYATIKKHLYINDPIPNQILTGKTLFKQAKHRTFATKIVLQMSAKLGGIPWKVPIPPKNTCVLGYDTYHDTVNKKKSYGALVGSYDRHLVKYFSVVTEHNEFTEISNNIKIMFTQVMRKYKEVNKEYPKEVVFYR